MGQCITRQPPPPYSAAPFLDEFAACIDQSGVHVVMALESAANAATDRVQEPHTVPAAIKAIRAFADAARAYRHPPTLCAVMARVLLLWKRLFEITARLEYPERTQDLLLIASVWRSANAEANRVLLQCAESTYGV